jgi:adenylosuccinate lyase
MTLDNVVSGLVVYPARVHSRLMEELPFMGMFTFSSESVHPDIPEL